MFKKPEGRLHVKYSKEGLGEQTLQKKTVTQPQKLSTMKHGKDLKECTEFQLAARQL